MVAVIKGAGDIASGIAARLYRSGIDLIMTDLEQPTSIRNTVCFSQAIVNGCASVEGIDALRCETHTDALKTVGSRKIAVLPDPGGKIIEKIKPVVVVDAILAKRNLGTGINDAQIVVACGPGFTAGTDCDAVVETMRGHDLGRVYYTGSAMENTGVPGDVGGFTTERLIKAPKAGVFHPVNKIGDIVKKGDTVAFVDDVPVTVKISGVLRGILPEGIEVYEGMKSGDVDPRCKVEHCYTCSDKALAVAGGVLEAVCNLKMGMSGNSI